MIKKSKSNIFFSALISILLLVTLIIWSSCKLAMIDEAEIAKPEEEQDIGLTEEVAEDEEIEENQRAALRFPQSRSHRSRAT